MRYLRSIDGLGRIVLPAEFLHHLNWEIGKTSASMEERDYYLIISFVPIARQSPGLLSSANPQNSPDGKSETISLLVSKK